MERKFRFGLFGKELKRFWWLGAALLLVAVLAIVVYSTAMYSPTYTVRAGESVYVEFSPTVMEKSNLSTGEEISKVYRRINGQEMKDFLSDQVKSKDSSIEKPEKNYKLENDGGIFYITVTMNDAKHSEAIANAYLERVSEEIDSGRFNEIDVKTFDADTYQAPILMSETGMTPTKLALFGVVGAIALFLIVVLCVFYFNRKLYDAQEFQENFKVYVLESNATVNGYGNVAIKLAVQNRESMLNTEAASAAKTVTKSAADKPYIVALARNIDADTFAVTLKKEGFSVLKTGIESVLSSNRELREEDGFDILYGTDGLLKSVDECRSALLKNYRYDFILVSANGNSKKNYITAASVADGVIVGFNLKKDDYKQIVSVFDELSVVKNINLLGVVL